MNKNVPTTHLARLACACAVLALTACASPQKAPATADVAVSRNAVENAVSAGAAELAPAEITAAREKMLRANQALAAKDYKLARELAIQAQADAKLAQSKANSAKATTASNQLNEDLRVLREEVDRVNNMGASQSGTTESGAATTTTTTPTTTPTTQQ